jgi:hypothetical protein
MLVLLILKNVVGILDLKRTSAAVHADAHWFVLMVYMKNWFS